MPKLMTPALKLLSTVWEDGNKDSWERINHSMHKALALAIGSGLAFKPSDFDHMAKQFRWGYWVGSSKEWIYTSAVLNLNTSCIHAFEEWTGRRPFRANNVTAPRYHDGFLHTNSIRRQRERLAVGMGFPHAGRQWWVTGFNDKQGTIRLASYAKHWKEGTPRKLLQISNDELKVICPAPKKKKAAAEADDEE